MDDARAWLAAHPKAPYYAGVTLLYLCWNVSKRPPPKNRVLYVLWTVAEWVTFLPWDTWLGGFKMPGTVWPPPARDDVTHEYSPGGSSPPPAPPPPQAPPSVPPGPRPPLDATPGADAPSPPGEPSFPPHEAPTRRDTGPGRPPGRLS